MNTQRRDADHRPAPQPLRDLLTILCLFILGVSCLCSWVLPQSKPDAVWGRLNYPQAMLAGVLTMLFLNVLIAVTAPHRSRKAIVFRSCALWLGTVVAVAAAELCSLYLPSEHLVNPWWVSSNAGLIEGSDDLTFERPPHLNWRGMSTGSIALELARSDPYAEEVTFETDFEGFRNGSDLRNAELIFIGDSYTEAGNVAEENTFVNRVGARLNVSVRNLGRMNYGPSQELIVLNRYGLKCRPQTVIWQISERNDLADEFLYQLWLDRGAPKDDFPGRIPRREVWKLRSPTFQLFKSLRRTQPWPYQARFRDADGVVHDVLFANLTSVHQRPAGHPGWPIFERALRDGAAILRDERVELAVVLIPMKYHAMGPFVEFSDATNKHRLNRKPPAPAETLSHAVAELCRELDVSYFDLTPCLKQAAESGQLVYLPLDTHLSAVGHQTVADEIVRRLLHHRATDE